MSDQTLADGCGYVAGFAAACLMALALGDGAQGALFTGLLAVLFVRLIKRTARWYGRRRASRGTP